MSIEFNLLLLHKPYDIHPRSWICFGGDGMRKIVSKLEGEVKTEKQKTREEISRIVSKKLGCHRALVKRALQNKNAFYPIPVILELSKLSKNGNFYLKKITSNIKYLKVNSASSKPSFALNKLTKDFCKVLGAFVADGSFGYQIIFSTEDESKIKFLKEIFSNSKIKFSAGRSPSRKEFFVSLRANRYNFKTIEMLIAKLSKDFNVQTHTNIELTDEHKSNVEAFKRWIKSCFGLEPTHFYKLKNENAWRIVFSNKIFGRYLMVFFGIIPGYKTDIVKEPVVIKNSPLNFRKAFARGVLMFDGSATISGNIVLESKSRALIDSIADIFLKDNVSAGIRISRGNHVLYTHKNNNKKRLLSYFEPDTWKEYRLREAYFHTGTKSLSIYRKYSFNKLTTDIVLKELRKIKSCDINYFMQKFNCRHTTVMNYLRILRNRGLISLTYRPLKFNSKNVSESANVFIAKNTHEMLFTNLKKKFERYDIAADYFNLHKATVSAWKVRKNRIPLKVIKLFCASLDLDFSEIASKAVATDRRIIELI